MGYAQTLVREGGEIILNFLKNPNSTILQWILPLKLFCRKTVTSPSLTSSFLFAAFSINVSSSLITHASDEVSSNSEKCWNKHCYSLRCQWTPGLERDAYFLQ